MANRAGFLNRLNTALHPEQDNERLAILATELGLAGAEVLASDYGFTQIQCAEWLDKMLDQAKKNRVSFMAYQAVQAIDKAAER